MCWNLIKERRQFSSNLFSYFYLKTNDWCRSEKIWSKDINWNTWTRWLENEPGNLINTVSFLSFQLTFDVRLIKKRCFIVSGLNSVDKGRRSETMLKWTMLLRWINCKFAVGRWHQDQKQGQQKWPSLRSTLAPGPTILTKMLGQQRMLLHFMTKWLRLIRGQTSNPEEQSKGKAPLAR